MAAPLRVGILNDMAETVAEAAEVDAGTMQLMRFAIDDLREHGRLDRDVDSSTRPGWACRPAPRSRSSVPSTSSPRRACS